MTDVLTMGELMLRLMPNDHQRIIQADAYMANYGGSEANVATSLALLGDDAAFISKLPDNALGEAALGTLRRYGVDTTRVLRGGERLGIYFFEKGASVRATSVVYDRANSAFANLKAAECDWPQLLAGVRYFYFSGITAALSPEIRAALLAACQYCASAGIQVVCDMNFRGKMWSPALAQQEMAKLMPYVNICIANDEDFEATLGIKAFDGDMTNGIAQRDQFASAMRQVTVQYPQCHTVASVVRDIHSVENSRWTALLLHNGQCYQGPIYPMQVFEGVAAGDAFGAGLMHGLLNGFEGQQIVDYAIAASVLKLTIPGDLNLITDAEVRRAMTHGNSVDR
ncbi:sugar kinase [Lacticaseibacillus daqingensis]|uniref:sugar kinase n=1 Tax=Lacticaseibacillus daqingensis TaxID=2486014 RepID=UPI000F7AAF58|nr:sugar kinase [Lacticaseibacillus daqingensis]